MFGIRLHFQTEHGVCIFNDASMLSVTYDKIRVIGGIKDTHTMFCLKV
jgi:hypothetical protein